MKIALIIALASGTIASSSIDPAKLFGISVKSADVANQTEQVIGVLSDAQALRDFESVVANMPVTSKLDPAAITAMIESQRAGAKEKFTEGKSRNEWGSTAVGKSLKEVQKALLDAGKATKRADDLQDEVDRLREKIESMRNQGKR